DVVDVAHLRFPRELVELAVQEREPFAEAVVRQAYALEDAAGLELDPAQLGGAVAAGALVGHAAVVEQALGVRAGVVREAGDDLVAGRGLAAAAGGGGERRGEGEGCEGRPRAPAAAVRAGRGCGVCER